MEKEYAHIEEGVTVSDTQIDTGNTAFVRPVGIKIESVPVQKQHIAELKKQIEQGLHAQQQLKNMEIYGADPDSMPEVKERAKLPVEQLKQKLEELQKELQKQKSHPLKTLRNFFLKFIDTPLRRAYHFGMEKMETQSHAVEQERINWFQEKLGKLIKMAGIPVAVATIMASCGEKGPTKADLGKFENDPSIERVEMGDLKVLEQIIEDAKTNKITEFSTENEFGSSEKVSIDTIDNTVSYEYFNKMDDMSKMLKHLYQLKEETVAYAENTAFNNNTDNVHTSGNIASLVIDKDTRIVTGAMTENSSYYIDGSMIKGNKEVAKKAVADFSEGLIATKKVIESPKQ